MTAMETLRRAERRVVTISCGYAGCSGCYMCKQITPPPRQANTNLTGSTGGITPGRSYAEALTGCPSTGLTRDYSSNHANLDRNINHGNLSVQFDDAMTDTAPTANPPSIPNPTDPVTTNKTKRQSWTKEEQVELFECYCEALKLGLSVTKGTYDIWRKKHPTIRTNLTPVTLSNQRRYAQKLLTQAEQRAIKIRISDDTPPDEIEAPPSTPSTETTQDPDTEEPTIEMKEMLDTLTVTYHRTKLTKMETRERPKRYIMDKANKERLKDMNIILTRFIRVNENLNISELNALHYAAAVTLSGVNSKTTEKNHPTLEVTLIKFLKTKLITTENG